jgi:hypothetical protein
MSSSRATRGAPVVERHYAPSPDACARALEILLKRPVKKAARPARRPDGSDPKEDDHDLVFRANSTSVP